MTIPNIERIQEVDSFTDANKLLDAGWILLCVGYIDMPDGLGWHKYSLGLLKK